MRQRRDPQEARLHHEEKLARASAEAKQLEAVVRLHEHRGLSWEEAQARVGLAMPHATLHQRLARWRKSGAEGLLDRRHRPPSPLTAETRGAIEGLGIAEPPMPSSRIRELVNQRYGKKLALRTVQEHLQAAGLARPVQHFRRKTEACECTVEDKPTAEALAGAEVEELGGAGLAMVRLGSDLTGYAKEMAAVISAKARAVASQEAPRPVDRACRNDKGQFLVEYNAVRPRTDPRMGAVFRSLEEKRPEKDMTRLQIAKVSPETLELKVLALMALPVVTEKGRFNGATDPRGEWLRSLGAHDYMPGTLSKFAREAKFAGVSGGLMTAHAQLWYRELSPSLGEDASAVVAYADGTTKPYWTAFFHRSGRVATVGRVMPCLESILIHTGSGVPLYQKTFAGHAALNKNVLPMLHELETALGQGMISRLTVLDGEANSVALFKAFDADVDPVSGRKKRYFITPLSSSQVKSLEDVKDFRYSVEYRDGDWVGGGFVELNDSSDRSAPPYRVRAVVLERRTKKTFTVFALNVPPEELDDCEAMDVYFHRWPAQEHVFRDLNQALDFKAVHGCGKRRVTNLTVVNELDKLSVQLTRDAARLQKAQLHEQELVKQLHTVDVQARAANRREASAKHQQVVLERANREHTVAYERAHQAQDAAHQQLGHVQDRLYKVQRELADAQGATQKIQTRITEKKSRFAALDTQREIYQTDVELDQILSVLKLGFALLVQFLLHRFFDGLAVELNTFIHEILALSGRRLTTERFEIIQLDGNRRSPKLMAKLETACEQINALRHQRDGRTVRFEVSWPPGTRDHAP